MARRRASMDSNSSGSSSPEHELDDDNDSIMQHGNESQSSLSVSLEDMEIENVEFAEQQRVAPICRLPAELLITIFSKLASPHDVLSCMLVCKAWARNSVDLLWHRPSTNRVDNLHNVINTAKKKDGYFAYHDLVKRLNLGQLKEEINDSTLQPLSVCKRIERLTLPGCSSLTDISLVPVIDGNRNLSAIDVSELELITDETIRVIAKNCFRLQGLNVSSCKAITDSSLVEVARHCRRLKRLKLNDCSQLTDLSVFAFADNCHDILEIDLFRCSNITDQAVTALIKEGKQLRELRLAQCLRVTDEAFLQLPTDQVYDALRILDLTDCNELQDAGLTKIVQAAPRLRNLVLAKCRNITDRGVSAITRLGKNLHFLHLGHCANITDVGVSQLVRHCNRIRYIDFSCCARLTDDSVALLANLPKLKRIGLVKCNNITDISIQALARPKAPASGNGYHPSNLERLHLSYCTNLTIPGVRTLLISCPQLTHLSLTGVPPFLREEILRFCREAPPEFNDHQRDVFCVFSGQKVKDLRNFLQAAFPTPPSSNAEFEDESPATPFSGPSSAPASARPFGVNAFSHPFDWAAPAPPALWVPNQRHGTLPLPRQFNHVFQPPTLVVPVSNQPTTSANSTTSFAQSAPSQQHNFMSPPLFASRSHSPTQTGGQHANMAANPGTPGQPRRSATPGAADAANSHTFFHHHQFPRATFEGQVMGDPRSSQVRVAQDHTRTTTPASNTLTNGQPAASTETPMAFPMTPASNSNQRLSNR
ncbi:MAG: hypothetical protein Q9162_002895 [Coniocarpon cinnabarinum]